MSPLHENEETEDPKSTSKVNSCIFLTVHLVKRSLKHPSVANCLPLPSFSSCLARSVFTIYFSTLCQPHERRSWLDLCAGVEHHLSLDPPRHLTGCPICKTFKHTPESGVWWRANLFPRWRRIPAGSREGRGGLFEAGVGGSTTGVRPFVVGFVAGALPVAIIPPGSARPLKTCMTSGGSRHIMEVLRASNTR